MDFVTLNPEKFDFNAIIEEAKKQVFEIISNYENQLPYHNTNHTQNVLERSLKIAEVFSISNKDRFLLQIAALFHDVIQFYEEKEVEIDVSPEEKIKTLKLFRQVGQNEEESAKKAENFMNRYGNLFSQEDIKRVRRAILATIPDFHEEEKTVYQPRLYEEIQLGFVDPVILCLALADLGGVGMLSFDEFKKENLRLFLEEFPEVKRLLLSESLSDEDEKKIVKLFKYWLNLQLSFIQGRKKLFYQEIEHLPDEVKNKLTALFSHFDENLKGIMGLSEISNFEDIKKILLEVLS